MIYKNERKSWDRSKVVRVARIGDTYYSERTEDIKIAYSWKRAKSDVHGTHYLTTMPYTRRLWKAKGDNAFVYNIPSMTPIPEVVNRVLEKVQNDADIYPNLGESLAEIRESVKLLTGGFVSAHNAFMFSYGVRHLDRRFVPKLWLTYNFGVMPLLGDIANIKNMLQQPRGWRHIEHKAFGIGSNTQRAYSTNTITYSHRRKCGIWVRLKEINPYKALLGLTNPIYTAWQIAGWSWAIDYFIDVSSILRNLGDWDVQFEHRDSYTKDVFEIISVECTRAEVHSISGFEMSRINWINGRRSLSIKFPGQTSSYANLFSALSINMRDYKDDVRNPKRVYNPRFEEYVKKFKKGKK